MVRFRVSVVSVVCSVVGAVVGTAGAIGVKVEGRLGGSTLAAWVAVGAGGVVFLVGVVLALALWVFPGTDDAAL